MNKMTKEAIATLRLIPKTKCKICGTPRSYTNPMAKCLKCGLKFCYNHITVIFGKKGTEDYCDRCLQ